MQEFQFSEKLTTVTASPTPLDDHRFPVTFIPIFADNCGGADTADHYNEESNGKPHKTNNNSKTNKKCSTSSSVASLSSTRTRLSLRSSSISTSGDSGATKTSQNYSTISPATSSTKPSSSSVLPGTSTTSTRSSSSSPTSISTSLLFEPTSLVPPVASATNLSTTPTPPAQTATLLSFSTAPASGLSTGAAVGMALGVFSGTTLLVLAGVFLFLFLRKREGRRGDYRDSHRLSKRKWKLAEVDLDSEVDLSRPLSSTWSWFGSVAIGSKSTKNEHRFKYGHPSGYRDARGGYAPAERNILETEKRASVDEWVAHIPLAAGIEYTDSPALRLQVTDREVKEVIRPASATESSISTLRFGRKKTEKPVAEAGKKTRDGSARDPFTDLQVPSIAGLLTNPNHVGGGTRAHGI